jgi:hypothetical protein
MSWLSSVVRAVTPPKVLRQAAVALIPWDEVEREVRERVERRLVLVAPLFVARLAAQEIARDVTAWLRDRLR